MMKYPCYLYKYGDNYKLVWLKTNSNNKNIKAKKEKEIEKPYIDDDGYIHSEHNIYRKEYKEIDGLIDRVCYDEFNNDITETVEKENQNTKEKLINSISRSKAKVKEYALCNEWQYFATFTLDSKKEYRFDLDAYIHDFGVWVGNYNKKYNTKLKYCVIPEKHKNGAWHLHGLLNGVTEDSISINQYGYYDLEYYKNRFGYISLSKIKDKSKVSNYITKYITKDMCQRINDTAKHLYYSSQKLNTKQMITSIETGVPEEIKTSKFTYENEYCIVSWIYENQVPNWYIREVLRGAKNEE